MMHLSAVGSLMTWFRRPRAVRNGSPRTNRSSRLSAELLEERNPTGNLAGGLFTAALGGPLLDPVTNMASAVGDLALLAADPASSLSPAGVAPNPSTALATGSPATGQDTLSSTPAPNQDGSIGTGVTTSTANAAWVGAIGVLPTIDGPGGGGTTTAVQLTQSGDSVVQTWYFRQFFNGDLGEPGDIYSNYDGYWAGDAIYGSLDVGLNGGGAHVWDYQPTVGYVYAEGDYYASPYAQTITYSAVGGQFNVLTPTEYGVSGSLVSSFSVSGYAPDFQTQLLDYGVLFVPDKDFSGTAQIIASGNDTIVTTVDGYVDSLTPTPVSRILTMNASPYDQGLYVASHNSLHQMDPLPDGGAPAAATPVDLSMAGAGALLGADAPAPAAPATGVRQGIDWSTLKFVQQTEIWDDDGSGGKLAGTIVKGDAFSVKTVKGNSIIVFSALPMNQQPQATQNNAGNKDITFNCHGYSFNCTNVTCPDGKVRDFSIVQDKDIKTLVADACGAPINVAQASDVFFAHKLFYVFYDKNGQAVHSCVGALIFGSANGKLTEDSRAYTKNGWDNLNNTGNVPLSDLHKLYKETTDIKMYQLPEARY
jgi:hypothetical protein